jgi:hypothetical protein
LANRRFNAARAVAVGLALTASACSASTRSSVSTGTTTSAPTSPGSTTPGTVAGQQPPGIGPEKVPIPDGPPLGPVKSQFYGQPIDAIQCEASEQVVYHVHAHLTIFVNGQPRQIPYAIGIAPPIQVTQTVSGGFVSGGSCFYWLHTHAADGIIHIESPTQKLYTLGQFFDMWGQSLAPGQVGPATGTLAIFVDGQPYSGNPRDIELTAHGQIQLDVGTVVPPQLFDWSQQPGL